MTTISDIAKQLGSRGGKKSVESRLGGKTKEERSAAMKLVRSSKLTAKMEIISDAFLQAIKDTPREEQY